MGSETKVKVVKNKMAPPFKTAIFEVLFNQGVNHVGEVIDLALENKVIEKSGSWLSFGDIRIGQGRDNASVFLRANLDLLTEIEERLQQRLLDNVIEIKDEPKDEDTASSDEQEEVA